MPEEPQRYWDEVEEGEEFALLAPMSTQSLVIWAAASGDFYPIHYDEEFARKNHLPGVIVHGGLKGMLVGRLLEEWIGEGGRIVHWKVSYRGMNRAREELQVWGRVVRKFREAGESGATPI